MVVVTRRLPRRPWALAFAGALFLLTAQGALADSTAPSQVDALWNQPQGTRVDSAFYVVQSWWDGLVRVAERDPRKRGLQELSQANEDLLNAYTLLEEARNDPGPHPVPVVDPFLSGTYGFITGVHVEAPIGSVVGWLNQAALHVEGRGSTETIITNLIRDYGVQNSRAQRDLASASDAPLAGIVTANTQRQTAMIARIVDVVPPSSSLVAMLKPATSAPKSAATVAPPAAGAAAARPTRSPAKAIPSPARGDDSRGGGDTHGKGNAAQAKPESR